MKLVGKWRVNAGGRLPEFHTSRSLTPGPPRFFAMNSTPAPSRAERMAVTVEARPRGRFHPHAETKADRISRADLRRERAYASGVKGWSGDLRSAPLSGGIRAPSGTLHEMSMNRRAETVARKMGASEPLPG